jgi:hypothetical protein
MVFPVLYAAPCPQGQSHKTLGFKVYGLGFKVLGLQFTI